MDVHAYYDNMSISKELLTRALYVFLRGDEDIHNSTCLEGIFCDGSGGVDDNIRIGTAAGAAADVLLSHYRQKQTVTIT